MAGKAGEGGDAVMADAEHAGPSGRQPVDRSEVRLPLEVATVVLECRWRDGNYYPARIIERRPGAGGTDEDYEYYVHYRKCE